MRDQDERKRQKQLVADAVAAKDRVGLVSDYDDLLDAAKETLKELSAYSINHGRDAIPSGVIRKLRETIEKAKKEVR